MALMILKLVHGLQMQMALSLYVYYPWTLGCRDALLLGAHRIRRSHAKESVKTYSSGLVKATNDLSTLIILRDAAVMLSLGQARENPTLRAVLARHLLKSGIIIPHI